VPDPKPGAPGHRKRRYLTGAGFERKKDAEEALEKDLKKYKNQGDRYFDRTTVGQYLTEWLDRRAALPPEKGGLKPSTERMYRRYIVNDIAPALGDRRLVKLTRNDVAGFIDDLIDAERGATTIHRIHATLSSALTSAVKRGLVDANPASLQDLPDITEHGITVWEKPDAVRFLEEARRGHRLAPLFEFAIFTGLRRGEVCGLKWEDVDLVAGRVTVRRNLVQVGSDVIEGAPKTKKGIRAVELSPELVDLLARLQDRTDREREEWGEAYQDSGRVFTYEDGRQLRPGYPSKVLDTLIERAGLPRLRFHDLRHQFASILNDLGEDIVTISKLMGHANTAVTSDLYTHMFEDKARRIAAAASAWLRPESVQEPSAGA
jgi:integrase